MHTVDRRSFLIHSLQYAFQLAVIGLLLHMVGIIDLGLHTSHGPVKSLALHGRMGRNIELAGASFSCPLPGGLEEGSSDPRAPHVLGHMDARQIQISLFPSKKVRLHGDKSLEIPLAESPIHKASCLNRIFQTFYQKHIIILRPVVYKGIAFYHPLSLFPAPAVCHHLTADKVTEQFPFYFLFFYPSILNHFPLPSAIAKNLSNLAIK